MNDPKDRQFQRLAFVWPALAMAAAREGAALIAKQFVGLATGADESRSTSRRCACAISA
jgi:hypothetical protein